MRKCKKWIGRVEEREKSVKLVHWTREKIEECDEWARDRKMEMPDSMVLKGTLTCIDPGRPLDKMYGGGMSGGGGSGELYRGVYEGRAVAISVVNGSVWFKLGSELV